MKLKFQLTDVTNGLLKLSKIILECVLLVGAAAIILVVAARAPELHGQWIRHKVGSKVYTIKDKAEGGGGTGFAMKAASGQTYILTNDHVCEVSSDKQTVLVENEEGLSIRRRIIEKSNFTDLCLIEGVPGVEGLSMGDEPMIGQIVASVGHPSLLPITLARGEVIARQDTPIMVGPISMFDPETGKEIFISPEAGGITPEQCMLPKNRQMVDEINVWGMFILKIKICVNLTEKAYKTNMLVQPGSSGSPVVNFFGNVVGVVFAGDRAMWGITVSQKDVVKFLKNY